MSITIHERQTDGILNGIKNAALRQFGGKTKDQKMAKEFVDNKCINLIASKKSRAEWTPEDKQKCNKAYDRHVFNEAFLLKDQPTVDAMYKTYIEKCAQNNEEVMDYEGFCKNFTIHKKLKISAAQKFNDYNCVTNILKHDTYDVMLPDFKTKNCLTVHAEKNVFNDAFKDGDVKDKSKLMVAYEQKCKDPQYYPHFCKSFQPPANYKPRTKAQIFNDLECAKIIDKRDSTLKWSELDEKMCKSLYNDKVFNQAYAYANDEQKKTINGAFTKRCEGNGDKMYPTFCNNFTLRKK